MNKLSTDYGTFVVSNLHIFYQIITTKKYAQIWKRKGISIYALERLWAGKDKMLKNPSRSTIR